MNERIQELKQQAVFDANKGFTLTGSHKIWTDQFAEKFAELIVRECANIAFDKYAATDGADSGESAILKHFGVEE